MLHSLQAVTASIAIAVACFRIDAQLLFSREYIIDNISTRIFRTLFEVTIDECINRCDKTKSCSFINYNRHGHVCSLIEQLDTTNPAVRKYSPGYISSDVSGGHLVNDRCQNCSTYEFCLNNTCVTQGCPPPNVSAEYQVSGNIYTIGSKLAYRCNGTDITDTDHVNYSTCLKNGSWSDFSLSCYQEPPPGYEIGFLSDGTRVAFKVYATYKSWSSALAACIDEGARLLQITTEPKFIFFQAVMQRSENRALDYLIDGTRPDESSPWLTSTGIPLPLVSNSQFWHNGAGLCVRTLRSANYRFSGQACHWSEHYICEA